MKNALRDALISSFTGVSDPAQRLAGLGISGADFTRSPSSTNQPIPARQRLPRVPVVSPFPVGEGPTADADDLLGNGDSNSDPWWLDPGSGDDERPWSSDLVDWFRDHGIGGLDDNDLPVEFDDRADLSALLAQAVTPDPFADPGGLVSDSASSVMDAVMEVAGELVGAAAGSLGTTRSTAGQPGIGTGSPDDTHGSTKGSAAGAKTPHVIFPGGYSYGPPGNKSDPSYPFQGGMAWDDSIVDPLARQGGYHGGKDHVDLPYMPNPESDDTAHYGPAAVAAASVGYRHAVTDPGWVGHIGFRTPATDVSGMVGSLDVPRDAGPVGMAGGFVGDLTPGFVDPVPYADPATTGYGHGGVSVGTPSQPANQPGGDPAGPEG